MSATLGYLYRHIIHDERMCVQFLQDRELLPTLNENNNRCTKVRNDEELGGLLKECERTSKKRNSG
jgi:hypothetical protein